MSKIKVGIVGFGNLGKALSEIISQRKNINLVKIFTKRQEIVLSNTKLFDSLDNLENYINKIDVLFLCCGSYGEIEKVGKRAIKNFNTIDCFDTHSKLKRHILFCNKVAITTNKIGLSACGWDPGIMSLIRTIFLGISGEIPHCFWGKGVSQGHSDAIRNIPGVENAIQYTIPNKDILKKCKTLEKYTPKSTKKHNRICYVSIKNGIQKKDISKRIKEMPNYFFGYKTKVVFTTNEEIKRKQKRLSHSGYIVKKFKLLNKYSNKLELKLTMNSNPHFTANIMLMCLNILIRLLQNKSYGFYTMLDIPLSMFTTFSRSELLEKIL